MPQSDLYSVVEMLVHRTIHTPHSCVLRLLRAAGSSSLWRSRFPARLLLEVAGDPACSVDLFFVDRRRLRPVLGSRLPAPVSFIRFGLFPRGYDSHCLAFAHHFRAGGILPTFFVTARLNPTISLFTWYRIRFKNPQVNLF